MNKTSSIVGIVVVIVAAGTVLVQHAGQQNRISQNYTMPPTASDAAAVQSQNQPVSENGIAQAASTYTMAQIAGHNDDKSCWTTIDGGVYDLTSWISQHPGGPEAILSICGIDGSAAFDAQHSGQRKPANELASMKIGTLSK